MSRWNPIKGMSSVYGRAMILIGASLTLVTILLTYATAQQQNTALIRELQSRVAALTEQQAVAVSNALWNLNRESVEIVLRGVARDRDFLAATVRDDKGRVFAHVGAVDLGRHRIEKTEAPIVLEEAGNRNVIGSLSLAFSLQRLEREQDKSLRLALVLGLLQLTAVLVATAWALRAVTGPLATITGRMLEIARGARLNDVVPYKDRTDQIGDIARAVGTFRTESLKRQQAEEELRLANANLDRRVRERTRDLTDRDTRLQGIMDNVSDGIVTVDERGVIESANRSVGHIFGYPEAELIGRNVEILVPNPNQGRDGDFIATYLQTGQERVAGAGPREASGRNRTGAEIPLELTTGEMRIGDARKFIIVFREISERKESERRLQQAQKMEAVGHLTGGIAHDFNNFLTVILGNLALLDQEVRDERVSRRTQPASIAAERGAELTKRLLAFSRRQPLNPRSVDVNDVIRDMHDMIRRSLGESIDIRTALAKNLWPTEIDVHQLESALLNLAINARDAMTGGGRLTIATSNLRLDREGMAAHGDAATDEYAVVAVGDTGTGMTPEVKERAFEPFFTTKEPGKGTGLGLSMVYSFAKQSHGFIEIDSDEGRGTTVRLLFPRARGTESSPVQAPSKTEFPTGTEDILVVEDDPDVRNLAVTLLQRLGYRTMSADSAAAALAVLRDQSEIRLLFTDMVLRGGMSGIALGREARAAMPALKVLYTTGHSKDAADHWGCLEKGAELLWKPYTMTTLAQKVRQVLDS